MLEIQADWNKVGMANRESNEQARNLFRSYFDKFFDAKQEFYTALKDKNALLKDKKIALIEKVKALESSTDWKQTSHDIINIQKEWKKIGSINRGEEQKLWKTFRSICDNFFNAKQAFFDQKDKENEGNLTLKKEIINKITSFELGENTKESIEQLKQFSNEFNAVGHVPFKEKEAIYQEYKKALETHYNKLKLEEDEKDRLLFENRLEVLKQSVDPERAFEKEKNNM